VTEQQSAVQALRNDPNFREAAKEFIREQLTEENTDLVIGEVVKLLPKGIRLIARAALDKVMPGALHAALEAIL
jgi:hypothetical protein